MATTGIGKQKMLVGIGANWKYGLVNLAAFLAEKDFPIHCDYDEGYSKYDDPMQEYYDEGYGSD